MFEHFNTPQEAYEFKLGATLKMEQKVLDILEASMEEAQDEQIVALLRQHHEETGSMVAEELLADWPTSLTRFTEVMPRDYRIVLEAKAKAEADGLDEKEVAEKMMESLHG